MAVAGRRPLVAAILSAALVRSTQMEDDIGAYTRQCAVKARRFRPALEQELCLEAGASCAFLERARFDAVKARIAGVDAATVGLLLSDQFRPSDSRVLLVAGARQDGFWAMVNSVMHAALLARLLGHDYAVWRNHSEDGMCEAEPSRMPDCWSALFAPPAHRTPAALAMEAALRARRPLPARSALGLPCLVRRDLWYAHGTRVYPDTMAKAAERVRRAALVRAVARPRDSVLRFVDAWWDAHVPRGRGGARPRVLGVHLRGTDKHKRAIVRAHCYYGLIDAYIAHHGAEVRVLVASDDAGLEADVLRRYGSGRVLRQSTSLVRGNRSEPVWRAGGRRYQRSFEAMVDTLLLARTDFLLKTASAVPEFALYYRPELPSYDLQIKDIPLPPWARARHHHQSSSHASATGRGDEPRAVAPGLRGCPATSIAYDRLAPPPLPVAGRRLS